MLSIVCIRFLRYIAPKIGLYDFPNERSEHITIIPRGGGIGLFLSIFAVFACFNTELLQEYLWTVVAIGIVFAIGIFDDYYDVSPYIKFLGIIVATILLYFNGIVIDRLGTFFGMELSLGWLALPFTVFAVSGFTNALNLIDGLDGLSATISIVILGVFMFIGIEHHDLFITTLSSLFIVALAAFLIFNWYPASIFMGDSGSLMLGFVISVLAIKALDYIPAVSILFIAAIPILDTLIVMIRRKRNGRSVFSADRCHIHHILKQLFADNTPKTVMILGIVQIVYSFVGLQIDKSSDEGVLLILFLLNVVLFYLFLGTMIKRQNRLC